MFFYGTRTGKSQRQLPLSPIHGYSMSLRVQDLPTQECLLNPFVGEEVGAGVGEPNPPDFKDIRAMGCFKRHLCILLDQEDAGANIVGFLDLIKD